jgi:hypothetical protein
MHALAVLCGVTVRSSAYNGAGPAHHWLDAAQRYGCIRLATHKLFVFLRSDDGSGSHL